MKEHLPLIKKKLKHASYFETLIGRREKVLAIMDKKNSQYLLLNEYAIVGAMLGMGLFIYLKQAYLFCVIFFSFVVTLLSLLCFEGKYPFATQKEEDVLDELDKELFDELVSDHTIMQDWAQLVVDKKTEKIFMDIVRNIRQGKSAELYDKMVYLLNAHKSALLDDENRISDQKTLDAMGVKLSAEVSHVYVADKDKLLALL